MDRFPLCYKDRSLAEGRWQAINRERPGRHADGLSRAHQAFLGAQLGARQHKEDLSLGREGTAQPESVSLAAGSFLVLCSEPEL